MEIYGRNGTLVATVSPQLCEVTLYGAQDGNSLTELPVPPRSVYVPAGLPKVSPYNIGQV
jgi:hypothetical protein